MTMTSVEQLSQIKRCLEMSRDLHKHATNLIIGGDLGMAERYLAHALKVAEDYNAKNPTTGSVT